MKIKLAYLATKVTVAVVLVVLIAAKATAVESSNIKMLPHSTERAVIVINTDNINSEVSIEDLKGSVVYYEKSILSDKIYLKILDFKNLEDGEYRLKVKNSLGKDEVLFKVANNNIEVVKEAISTTPFLKVEDNMLKISYLNHSLSNAYITIYNEEVEVFKKELGKDFCINAGFDINQLGTVNYMASFGSDEETYSYIFSK